MREPPANCDHSEVAGRLTSFRGCAWPHRMRAAASGCKADIRKGTPCRSRATSEAWLYETAFTAHDCCGYGAHYSDMITSALPSVATEIEPDRMRPIKTACDRVSNL